MATNVAVYNVKVVERRTFLNLELIRERGNGAHALARSASDSAIVCQSQSCQKDSKGSEASICDASDCEDKTAVTAMGEEAGPTDIDAADSGIANEIGSAAVAAMPEVCAMQRACPFPSQWEVSGSLPADIYSLEPACTASPQGSAWEPTERSKVASYHSQRCPYSGALIAPNDRGHFAMQQAQRQQEGGNCWQFGPRCAHAPYSYRRQKSSWGERIDMSTEVVPIGPTTILLRNIPPAWTRDHVVAVLDCEGFRASYDFVHVPLKFHDLSNVGYALVNLTDPRIAEQSRRYFDGFRPRSDQQLEALSVDWNHPTQGLFVHVERYRNSPMMHKEISDLYRPGLYSNGLRIPFPEPTVHIRAPRVPKCKRVPGATRAA